jgi:GGDEF domain-containing protein
MLKQDIEKVKIKLKQLNERTEDIVNNIYKNILLEKYNEETLKRILTEVEKSFLKQGGDYSIIKISFNNAKEILNQNEYYVLSDLKSLIAEILDENIKNNDLVSRYLNDGFLVVMRKASDDEIEEYVSNVGYLVNQLTMVKDNNLNVDFSYEVLRRSKMLENKNFLETVLN